MLMKHLQILIFLALYITSSGINGDGDQLVMAKAVIHLQDVLTNKYMPQGSPASWGVVTLRQDYVESPVIVSGTIKGLLPGKHGFSIQELGDLQTGCDAAGDHFNPENKSHGGLFSSERHTGDMGNFFVHNNYTGYIDIAHCNIPLRGPKSIIGRMVVIYANEDDLGQGDEEDSSTTGSTGDRVGCGVIGIASDDYNPLGPTAESDTRLLPNDTIIAKAVLHNAQMLNGSKTPYYETYRLGTITLVQEKRNQWVTVTGKLEGLTPGLHGFHIHTLGTLENGCTSAVGHYNPENKQHGARWDFERHVGDLGNVDADQYGVARINFQDSHIQLIGAHSIIGRTLVVHGGPDDLGLGDNYESKVTGNAGPRIACGVVGIAVEDYNPLAGVPVEQTKNE